MNFAKKFVFSQKKDLEDFTNHLEKKFFFFDSSHYNGTTYPEIIDCS